MNDEKEGPDPLFDAVERVDDWVQKRMDSVAFWLMRRMHLRKVVLVSGCWWGMYAWLLYISIVCSRKGQQGMSLFFAIVCSGLISYSLISTVRHVQHENRSGMPVKLDGEGERNWFMKICSFIGSLMALRHIIAMIFAYKTGWPYLGEMTPASASLSMLSMVGVFCAMYFLNTPPTPPPKEEKEESSLFEPEPDAA